VRQAEDCIIHKIIYVTGRGGVRFGKAGRGVERRGQVRWVELRQAKARSSF